MNQLPAEDIVELIKMQPATGKAKLWDGLMLDTATEVLQQLPDTEVGRVLQKGDPVHASRVIVRLPDEQRREILKQVDSARGRELNSLAQYPENSAGSLMDPRFLTLHKSLTVKEVLRRIRKHKPPFTRQLFVIDEEGRLQYVVETHRWVRTRPSHPQFS